MANRILPSFKLPGWVSGFLLHFITWLLVWAAIRYFSVPTLSRDNEVVVRLASVAIMTQTLFIFYFLGYIAFPRFLYQRQIIPLIITLLLLFQAIYIFNYYEFSYLAQISDARGKMNALYIVRAWNLYMKNNPFTVCFTDFKIAYFNYAWSFFYVTPILAIKVMRDIVVSRTQNLRLERDRLQLERNNLDLQSQSLKLQRDNLNLELSFLKSQINPHFLFNTLNAIYARTADVDDHAADLVLRLSNLMRYGLYESNRERVPLSKEVDYIESYIELEKARFAEKTKITYELQGNPDHYFIAPLLLISFVENAFKHGAAKSPRNSYVHIGILLAGSQLIFSVKNSTPPKSAWVDHERKEKEKPGGFGLDNTAKRLELLYPGKHNLTIQDREGTFEILLEINLMSLSRIEEASQK
jgi:two-component system LytT family sensor kinase